MIRFAAFVAFALSIPGAALAQDHPPAQPITIGQTHTLSALDADREVNVILPRGYSESEEEYPLAIMLDGGLDQDMFLALGLERWNQLWGRSQQAILVGVQTVDRQRELLPPTRDEAEQERYPTAGQSLDFRDWLAGEVLPVLRERYRHDGRAFLIGESAAGHFVVETWINAPNMFDGYAALSPSFQWDDQSLSRGFSTAPDEMRPPLYVSLADEGGATEEGALRFLNAAGQMVCFADRRDSHVRHANSLQQLLPEALQFLLPTPADWLEEYGMTVGCEPFTPPSDQQSDPLTQP